MSFSGSASLWRRMSLPASGQMMRLAVAIFGLAVVWGLAVAAGARAALPAGCTQSGQVVTCTFPSTGAEQSFSVPPGVTSVQVTAIGGAGGDGEIAVGGAGAMVSGSLSVSAPETLFVEVGGAGSTGGTAAGAAFNGGGLPGDQSAAGGGGASDVRTVSCGSPCVTTDPMSLGSRLLIAAGEGGAGEPVMASGGDGGPAGASGTQGGGVLAAGGGGGGQPPAPIGGTGGSGGYASSPPSSGGLPGARGGDGSLGKGGDGAAVYGGTGGGGGGGLYGGGGGGGGGRDNATDTEGSGGGGGGGSSLAPTGGSIGLAASTAVPPSVTISYTVPPPPTCQPVSTSTPAGQAVTVQLSCTDTTGATLTYAIVSGPSNGTLGTINQTTGQVVYTPNSGYSGPDSFTYDATSSNGTATAQTVSITVVPAPTCQPVSTSTPAGQAVTVQLSCTDSTGATSTYAIVSGPSNGTLGTINQSTGQVTYTPNSGYSGPDSFTYNATSSNGTATAQTASITVTPVTPTGADLGVGLSLFPGQVHYLSPLIYTATVTNHGPGAPAPCS